MKTQSFELPNILEAIGDGSYRYCFNIEKITEHSADEIDYYLFDAVKVYQPLTANRIIQAVIAEQWDSNYEQKLINEYNSAQLGLYTASVKEEKIKKYTEFLKQRAATKKQVENDCKNLNII